MEKINTVNFEDLFDLSPEPVDRAAAPVPVQEDLTASAYHDNVRLENDRRESNKTRENVFAEFDTLLAGHFEERRDLNKLSASFPSNWSGAASTSTASSSAGDAGGRVFTVGSVGQLLNDLPEVPDPGSPSLPAPAVGKSKRGRKPGQRSLRTDMKTKLERSRQSARECRARKKLRYQYLDDLLLEREKANEVLREELLRYQKWCHELDKGRIPEGLHKILKDHEASSSKK